MQVEEKVIETFLEVPDLDLLPEADDQDMLHQLQGHGALGAVLQPEVPLPAPGGRAVEPHPRDLGRAEAGQVAASEAGERPGLQLQAEHLLRPLPRLLPRPLHQPGAELTGLGEQRDLAAALRPPHPQLGHVARPRPAPRDEAGTVRGRQRGHPATRPL